MYRHPDAWAKVWAKDTGLPYEVALASVKRTNASRIAVAVDKPLIASEQQIADTFTELKLIPARSTSPPSWTRVSTAACPPPP